MDTELRKYYTKQDLIKIVSEKYRTKPKQKKAIFVPLPPDENKPYAP